MAQAFFFLNLTVFLTVSPEPLVRLKKIYKFISQLKEKLVNKRWRFTRVFSSHWDIDRLSIPYRNRIVK